MTGGASALPRPDHIVIVIEENRSPADIIGSKDAPYINALAARGALFTNSHAITHPSQPNYLALFYGDIAGVDENTCLKAPIDAPSLGGKLIAAGLTFTGFAESLPEVGSTVCATPDLYYVRKHNPWVNFADVPPSSNRPFTDFPADFAALPTVSFVVPNQYNDIHEGTIAEGDYWLGQNLDAYVRWATDHRSLLILTFDEDHLDTPDNLITTVFVGDGVKPGSYDAPIDHYAVLRTIEEMYGLPHHRETVAAKAITGVWDPEPGDLDHNGTVDAVDVQIAFGLFLGRKTPTADEIRRADVRPRPGVGGIGYGDGRIGADDLNWLLRRSLALTSAP